MVPSAEAVKYSGSGCLQDWFITLLTACLDAADGGKQDGSRADGLIREAAHTLAGTHAEDEQYVRKGACIKRRARLLTARLVGGREDLMIWMERSSRMNRSAASD